MAFLTTVGTLEVVARPGTGSSVGSVRDKSLRRTLSTMFVVESSGVSAAAHLAEFVLGPADHVVMAPDMAFAALWWDLRAQMRYNRVRRPFKV
jgi:hypothetical protein